MRYYSECQVKVIQLIIRRIKATCGSTKISKLTEDLVNTGELENILHDKAGGGEHANTAVLELGLTKPADVDE
jgi:hypothetical protein